MSNPLQGLIADFLAMYVFSRFRSSKQKCQHNVHILCVTLMHQGLIAKDFALKEWKSVIRSLASYLSHARWLNPLAASELLNCKPHQLRLAQQVGLTVPKTTITNNPAAVEKIFDEVDHGRVIFKSLTPLFLPPNKLLYTTEITKEFPSASRDSITQCPAIYQELVERKSDLRITVVGRKVFPVRIASQILEDQKDRLDWRRCQDKEELFSEAQVQSSDSNVDACKRMGMSRSFCSTNLEYFFCSCSFVSGIHKAPFLG